MYKGSNHFKVRTKHQKALMTHTIDNFHSGKSQGVLAQMVGDYTIDGDVLGKFKRGERVIPPRCFDSIAEGLNISKEVLFDAMVRDYAESLQNEIEAHRLRMGLTDKTN